MNDRISAPNVYLYAFQLYNDTDRTNNPLWQQCDKIMAKFTYTYERLTPHLVFPQNSHRYSEDLLSDTALFFNTRNPLIEGFAQPRQFQDSYGLCLNIGCLENGTADNIDVSFIEKMAILLRHSIDRVNCSVVPFLNMVQLPILPIIATCLSGCFATNKPMWILTFVKRKSLTSYFTATKSLRLFKTAARFTMNLIQNTAPLKKIWRICSSNLLKELS